MFCPKCGTRNPDGTRFCQACGSDTATQAVAAPQYPPQGQQLPPSQQPYPGQPPYPGQQPYSGQQQNSGQPPYPGQQPYPPQAQYPNPQAGWPGPAYQQGMPGRQVKQKKSRTGCLILLVLLLIVIAGAAWFLGSFSYFKPKDLGVEYEKKDFTQVLQKMGTQLDARLRPEDLGDALEDVKAAGGKEVTENGKAFIQMDNDVLIGMAGNNDKMKKLNPSDYEWTFSDFQQKVFKISGNEASAFFNETAPSFWWFRQTQIKVVGGNILTSSKLDIAGLTKALFSDVAGKIPIPLPEKANLYTEGRISILDNHISMKPEVFNIGPVPLPEQFKTDEANTVVASYLDRIITMIPGLVINRIEENSGVFDVDALIPQKVTVRAK